MSDAVVATPVAVKAQKKKSSAKPKNPANHPKYSEMIKEAVAALKERGGSSRQAVLKHIMANFNVGKDEKVVNQHLKLALRAGVKTGGLKQSKGSGASGSFRLGEATKKARKPKKVKKPKAAKPKKTKKVSKPKKVKTPKKATAKPKKAKSPKKTGAKPKKANTPKKTAAKPKKAAAKPKKALAK
jgi:histone H1/5